MGSAIRKRENGNINFFDHAHEPMPSAAVKAINATRFRVVRAQTALAEAIELVRAAAAAADYHGPANLVEDIERVAAGLGAVRTSLRDWAIEQNLAHPPVPRLVSRSASRSAVGQALAEAVSR